MKYHIEKNSVQETLVIPLYGRKICMDKYPDLFYDKYCNELLSKLDWNFEAWSKKIPIFGALEAGMRQYDLCCEVEDYLKDHPRACVVNLGCGLDTTFAQIDNGLVKGYNLDKADVIDIRNQLLPPKTREYNIACDLTNTKWFEQIDFNKEDGVVFIAGGVFYYFKRDEVKSLFCQMAQYFTGGRLSFDTTTALGLKMMMKTVIKESGIDVGAYFSVNNLHKEISPWSDKITRVVRKKYMTGYRKPDRRLGIVNRTLSYIADWTKLCQIAQITF